MYEVLAMQVKQGREVGSRPSTIVQLLNAVYQEIIYAYKLLIILLIIIMS